MFITAPWTINQVEAIKAYQEMAGGPKGTIQPYLCRREMTHGKLEVTKTGLFCQSCTYKQPWIFEEHLNIVRLARGEDLKDEAENT